MAVCQHCPTHWLPLPLPPHCPPLPLQSRACLHLTPLLCPRPSPPPAPAPAVVDLARTASKWQSVAKAALMLTASIGGSSVSDLQPSPYMPGRVREVSWCGGGSSSLPSQISEQQPPPPGSDATAAGNGPMSLTSLVAWANGCLRGSGGEFSRQESIVSTVSPLGSCHMTADAEAGGVGEGGAGHHAPAVPPASRRTTRMGVLADSFTSVGSPDDLEPEPSPTRPSALGVLATAAGVLAAAATDASVPPKAGRLDGGGSSALPSMIPHVTHSATASLLPALSSSSPEVAPPKTSMIPPPPPPPSLHRSSYVLQPLLTTHSESEADHAILATAASPAPRLEQSLSRSGTLTLIPSPS